MEICGKCNIRFFMGQCGCKPPTITLDALRELVGDDICVTAYGHPEGRIEEYSLDSDTMYGVDSGGYKSIPLEELDLDYIRSISKLTEVYKA